MNVHLLLSCTISAALFAAPGLAEQICNGKSAATNVREGPSAKGYSIVARLPNGADVQILGRTTNSEGYDYVKVQFTQPTSDTPGVGYVYGPLVASLCSRIAAPPRDDNLAEGEQAHEVAGGQSPTDDIARDLRDELRKRDEEILALRSERASLEAEVRGLSTQIPSAPQPSTSPAWAQVPVGSQPRLFDLTGKFIKLTQNGDDQFIVFKDDRLCIYSDCVKYDRRVDGIWVTFPHSDSEQHIEIKGESLVINNSPPNMISLLGEFLDSSLDGAYFKEGSANVDYLHKALEIGDQSPTVVSTGTGLEWMRCAVGQEWSGTACIGQATTMKWQDAMRRYEHRFSAFGHNDWRLPTAMEFRWFVLNDHPLITSHLAFPNNPDGVYWSSSKSPWYIYGLNFDHYISSGQLYLYPRWSIADNVPESNDGYVRLVRRKGARLN